MLELLRSSGLRIAIYTDPGSLLFGVMNSDAWCGGVLEITATVPY